MHHHKQRHVRRNLPSKWMNYAAADNGAAVVIDSDMDGVPGSVKAIKIDGARCVVFYVCRKDGEYLIRASVVTVGYGGKVLQAATPEPVVNSGGVLNISALDAIPHPDYPRSRWVLAYYENTAVGVYRARAVVCQLHPDGTFSVGTPNNLNNDVRGGRPGLAPFGDAADDSYVGVTYRPTSSTRPYTRILDAVGMSLVSVGAPVIFTDANASGDAALAPIGDARMVAYFVSEYDAQPDSQVICEVSRVGSTISYSGNTRINGGDYSISGPGGSFAYNAFPIERRIYSRQLQDDTFLVLPQWHMYAEERSAPPGGSWSPWYGRYEGNVGSRSYDPANPGVFPALSGVAARQGVRSAEAGAAGYTEGALFINDTGRTPRFAFTGVWRDVAAYEIGGDTVGEGAVSPYDRKGAGQAPGVVHDVQFATMRDICGIDEIRVLMASAASTPALEGRILYAGGGVQP